jgi:hypothetical protein
MLTFLEDARPVYLHDARVVFVLLVETHVGDTPCSNQRNIKRAGGRKYSQLFSWRTAQWDDVGGTLFTSDFKVLAATWASMRNNSSA